MAAVYLAFDRKLQRHVALKIMHEHMQGRDSLRQRFRQEAYSVSKLRHPNILEIYDFSGEDVNDLWLVMEYIEGYDLNDYTACFPHHQIHPMVATCIAREVGKALSEAHRHGIVHRDVKPSNIMVSYTGQIKLMDFGIAKDLVVDHDLTITGSFIGSPSFMPPEQVRGESMDVRVDIYALSVLFFKLLTGKLPYEGENSHVIMDKVLSAPVPKVQDIKRAVPSYLSKFIYKGMAKEAKNRHQAVKSMVESLDQYLRRHQLGDSGVELELFFSSPREFAKKVQKNAKGLGEGIRLKARSQPRPRPSLITQSKNRQARHQDSTNRSASPGPAPAPAPGQAGGKARSSNRRPSHLKKDQSHQRSEKKRSQKSPAPSSSSSPASSSPSSQSKKKSPQQKKHKAPAKPKNKKAAARDRGSKDSGAPKKAAKGKAAKGDDRSPAHKIKKISSNKIALESEGAQTPKPSQKPSQKPSKNKTIDGNLSKTHAKGLKNNQLVPLGTVMDQKKLNKVVQLSPPAKTQRHHRKALLPRLKTQHRSSSQKGVPYAAALVRDRARAKKLAPSQQQNVGSPSPNSQRFDTIIVSAKSVHGGSKSSSVSSSDHRQKSTAAVMASPRPASSSRPREVLVISGLAAIFLAMVGGGWALINSRDHWQLPDWLTSSPVFLMSAPEATYSSLSTSSLSTPAGTPQNPSSESASSTTPRSPSATQTAPAATSRLQQAQSNIRSTQATTSGNAYRPPKASTRTGARAATPSPAPAPLLRTTKPSHGALEAFVTPSATVILGNRNLGPSHRVFKKPLHLTPGRTRLILQKNGYETHRVNLDIIKGKVLKLGKIQLKKHTYHALAIEGSPGTKFVVRARDFPFSKSWILSSAKQTIKLRRGVYEIVAERKGRKIRRNVRLPSSYGNIVVSLEL